MNILSEVKAIIDSVGLPAETGAFQDDATDEYVVVTPLGENFELYADNRPQAETQEARLSLYSKYDYQQKKIQITKGLLDSGITITDRRYIEYEKDTGYHHYVIDILKVYRIREE